VADWTRLQRESQARIRREVEQPSAGGRHHQNHAGAKLPLRPEHRGALPHHRRRWPGHRGPGTRVNPLDTVSLSRPLLFIDARDTAQLDRAQRLLASARARVKLILTGGSYLDLMRRWKLAVFYDQQGHLTTQLGIRHVPALVTQDGKRLRIDELL
jgi:conjugal transfer pilus assembly protein TraW